ncbi:flagellar hook capping FlgD N-terminal domain-containing protein [Castellaniella sp.]|uniref:flagellar hook capping FlgD N-terminal domain-containing protein n=1 Tax=Castellaniella sp. TaxID=1955812 RepID=UPI002AFEEF74|nr:flagellar hook capping FlgD N-terminal domain-containing protein [Castellaniella sp.]
MTAVNEVYGAGAAGAALGAQTKSLLGDTQDRFLTLLVTQLQNQDPLNPMDNAEVTSQIAQLSTVQGITQLNNTLLALTGQMDMSQSLQAAGLIGKDILYPGETVKVGADGASTPFGIDLMSGVTKATVTIRDNSGRVVYSHDMGPQGAGIYPLNWDGKDTAGVVVPEGAYTVSVDAFNADGKPVSAETLTAGSINSIAYTAEGLRLNLMDGGKISLLDIRQVM